MPEGYRERPGPTKVYCILFTPRSGSTWLTQEIGRLSVMSYPLEYFNADEFHNSLVEYPCANLREYYDVVSKKHRTMDGLFGFEIGYWHLAELEKDLQLLNLLPESRKFIYLKRQNFVAQGVSLYLATETRRFHSFTTPKTPDEKEHPVSYIGPMIKAWIAHILYQEYAIEQWLQARDLTALRITYEEMFPDIEGVIAKIAQWIGVDVDFNRPRLPIPSPTRLYSDVNREFEDRFRQENREWCDEWTTLRGRSTDQLDRLWQLGLNYRRAGDPATPLS
ncbi:MAG: Stf0 family sulfotransferase [Stellaceae bacterium]